MTDQSYLDDMYFVDQYIYNCPFCNRRHVSYDISRHYSFNWTNEKECFVYFVKCKSCEMESMHLSFHDLPVDSDYRGQKFSEEVSDLDDLFFYSVPSSFFTVDKRIPRILRELFAEAEGCLKSNFLTGASACARKIVYELSEREDSEGDDYETRIKSLKSKFPGIDPTYFDTLLTIQQVTSEKVHENAYDGWQSKHLRVILAHLLEILNEIYVLPKVRNEKRKSLLEMKEEVLGDKPIGTERDAEQD